MQEYIVIKKGSSINKCIELPDEFLNMELEIKIRPLKFAGKISKRLERLYEKYPTVKPFEGIADPVSLQRKIRDEWE